MQGMEQNWHVQAAAHRADAASAVAINDLDQALKKLIVTSDLYVNALHQATTKGERTEIGNKLHECIQEAERVKQQQKIRPPKQTSPMKPDTFHCGSHEPIELVDSSKKSEALILKSSKISSYVFVPWREESVHKYLHTDRPYVDDQDTFRITSNSFGPLVQVSEMFDHPILFDPDLCLFDTIVQSRLTDCSFVSSIIAADQLRSRFGEALLSHCFRPQDAKNLPTNSASGMYLIRLFINGTHRLVMVDSHIPSNHAGKARSCLAYSAVHLNILWPAILEKAYLKVTGLNSRGSNPASDLFMLTSWVPEQIPIRNNSRDLINIWKDIAEHWHIGNVLVTLGSAEFGNSLDETDGIVSSHSYALTGITERQGCTILTLQNPWQPEERSLEPSIFTGTFELDMEILIQKFQTIFLNWRPSLWKHRASLHLRISPDQRASTDLNISICPQFLLSGKSSEPLQIHIVLSRHRTKHYTELENGDSLCMSIYRASQRVLTTMGHLQRTDFLSTMDLSIKTTIPPHETLLLAVSQRMCPQVDTFSLVCYVNNDHFKLVELPQTPYQQVFESEWLVDTAGGNPMNHTYITNPQYNITVNAGSKVSILLECTHDHDINIDLIYGHRRPLKLESQDLVIPSQPYTQKCVAVSVTLKPGDYTVILSTFKTGQFAPFKLSLLSNEPISVIKSKELGAGQVRQSRQSHWLAPALDRTYILSTPRSNFMSVHLSAHGQVPIRMQLLNTRVVARTEGTNRIALDKVALQRDVEYTLTVSCHGARSRKIDFDMNVFSDGKLLIQETNASC